MIAALIILAAAVEPLAVTNLNLVSESTNIAAWTRQAVMARADNSIIDPSGVFVKAADAAVQSNAANRVSAISQAAIDGMRDAVGSLAAVTNQVPDAAYHVSVTLPPPKAPTALMGFVVKEETDGYTDTQWVWYSQALARKPIRRVVYKTPSGDVSQNVEWVDWSKAGETISALGRVWEGCHKCTIPRPAAARGVAAITRLNERFGGANGFDFGSIVVMANGKPGITTNLTDAATGSTLIIENGFIVTKTKEGE